MWNKVIDDWKSDDQKEEDLEVYCPFLMPDAGNAFTVVV